MGFLELMNQVPMGDPTNKAGIIVHWAKQPRSNLQNCDMPRIRKQIMNTKMGGHVSKNIAAMSDLFACIVRSEKASSYDNYPPVMNYTECNIQCD